MNPHQAHFFRDNTGAIKITDGWDLIRLFSNIESTKEYISQVEEKTRVLDERLAEITRREDELAREVKALEAGRASLEADLENLGKSKATHNAVVEAFNAKRDQQAEREKDLLAESMALDAKRSAQDSRESDLSELKLELDGRAADLKRERQEFETRFAKAKTILAAVSE